MTAEGAAAMAAILSEADEWQRIMALDVYLDMKSPHAYLAVRPSLQVARDYRVRLNFLPYLMNYITLGISTSVDEDMKRRPPRVRRPTEGRGCTMPLHGSTPPYRACPSAAHTACSIPSLRARPCCSPSNRGWRCRS